MASIEIPSSPASVSRVSPSTYLRVSAVRYWSGRCATAMWTRSRVSARSSTSPGSGRSAIAAKVCASVTSMRSHAACSSSRALVGAQVVADHVARQHGQPAADRAARRVVVGLARQRERERLLDHVLREGLIAADPVEHERVQALDVRVVEPADRLAVAGPGRAQVAAGSKQPAYQGQDHRGLSMSGGVIEPARGVGGSHDGHPARSRNPLAGNGFRGILVVPTCGGCPLASRSRPRSTPRRSCGSASSRPDLHPRRPRPGR